MNDSEQLTKIYDLTFEAGLIYADMSAVDKVQSLIIQRDRAERQRNDLRALSRRVRESLADYVARLDKLHDDHLDGCRDCNYDRECMQCAADDDGDAHNCNCGDGIGYGYQLRETLEVARIALMTTPREP